MDEGARFATVADQPWAQGGTAALTPAPGRPMMGRMSSPKDYDPYKAPTAPLESASSSGAGTEAVSASVVALLSQTRPWVKLMGVLVFVGLVFGGLGAVVMLISARAQPDTPPGMGLAMIPILLVMLLYIPPGLYLLRYAGSIRLLEQGAGQPALVEALGHQKSFWKFVGILALVMMSFYALVVVVAIIAGVAGVRGAG